MKKITIISAVALLLLAITQTHQFFPLNTVKRLFPAGKQTYQQLNKNPLDPFIISWGTSMSQTHHTANIAHPDAIFSLLRKECHKQADPLTWISHKNRIWYVLKHLPIISCASCQITINPNSLNLRKDAKIIKNIINDIMQNSPHHTLTITRCPKCKQANAITKTPQPAAIFTDAHKYTFLQQIQHINPHRQYNPAIKLPTSRLSIEAADILRDNDTKICPTKLQAQVDFLQAMGNPMLFLHHYANPQSIPYFLQKTEDIAWFADYCAQVAAACPFISHICPISQPIAFGYRVGRNHDLPPFACSIPLEQFFNNIAQAQIAACKAIKKFNPATQVLVSHQWKPMKPKHGVGDPRRVLELFISKIAHKMYNGKFVELFQPQQQCFDGIALSVYPPIYFDLWAPLGANDNDELNPQAALEAVLETHKAFPAKDIYIAETGCNSADPQRKKDFIDMMLQVCKIAKDQGVPIKGIYFWGHTNDPVFYSEWNYPQGKTNFAPYDRLDAHDPIGSINAAGNHLKDILE